ncbi:MAG: hypothetical protein H7096_05100 [Flavobacterium sp.]|nr:hypothetical protein [Pedobacter sp.]
MKTSKIILFVLFFSVIFFSSITSNAQCSMCALSAENSVQNGNTQGRGLNSGILYLLAAPYIAIAGVGFVWYKKYRRKNVRIDIKDEKINLN